jgi:hypothetical protein
MVIVFSYFYLKAIFINPSFPRRRESTSATMDSRLRGNDGNAVSWFNP